MSEHSIKHVTKADGNVFADLGFDPIEAASLKLRAELAAELNNWAAKSGKTQTAIGEIWGVTQGRVSDLKKGKLRLFSLDMLVTFAAKSGLNPAITFKAA